jgi:electron transfer flavoprotein beta subunit
MRIAVAVKRVPDTAARVKVAADGRSIERAGVEHVISPYDEIAVEAALQLKEKHSPGEGEVAVVTVGPAAAQKELRTCLAMGADRAILLKDDAPFRDGSSTALILAAALKEGAAFDLVLFGWKAADDDGAQVGLRVAEILSLPAVTLVTKIEIDWAAKKLVCHREVEGGVEVVETTLPAVVTAQKGLAEPRYASLKGIMAAKKKPLEEKPLPSAADSAFMEVVKLETPPPRPPGRIVGEGVAAVPELVALLRNEAKVI